MDFYEPNMRELRSRALNPGRSFSPFIADKVLSVMGEGTFGRVLECWDRILHEYCAVKVVRAVSKYRHAAMMELEVLGTLKKNDPTGKWHCVYLKNW